MRNGTPRTRHLRHRTLDRAGRQENLENFLSERSDTLDSTATAQNFTVDADEDTLAITGHGLAEGEGPYLLTTSGTLPAGLAEDVFYWVAVVDANTIQLATTRERAARGFVEDITDTGSGTHTLTKAATSPAMFEMLKTNKPETMAAAIDVDALA